MTRKHSDKGNADWKQREQLVALIERCISTDAHVEHDVRLPVVGTTRKRQCDVVIRYGKPPRDSLAIVEVQKRNRKPDITTFHGWVRKMEEVGAQHLICVSALGYPKSVVVDVAARLGPSVKLLTLKDLEAGTDLSGFALMPTLVELCPKYNILAAGIGLDQAIGQNDVEVSSGEAAFSVAGEADRLSLDDIISRTLTNSARIDLPPPHLVADWSKSVELALDGSSSLVFHHEGGTARVRELRTSVLITCEISTKSIPVHNLSYEQVDYEGALAWLATTRFQHQGRDLEFTVVATHREGHWSFLCTPVGILGSSQVQEGLS